MWNFWKCTWCFSKIEMKIRKNGDFFFNMCTRQKSDWLLIINQAACSWLIRWGWGMAALDGSQCWPSDYENDFMKTRDVKVSTKWWRDGSQTHWYGGSGTGLVQVNYILSMMTLFLQVYKGHLARKSWFNFTFMVRLIKQHNFLYTVSELYAIHILMYLYVVTVCNDLTDGHIDGLVQKRHNSSALAMDLYFSCTKSTIYCFIHWSSLLLMLCAVHYSI